MANIMSMADIKNRPSREGYDLSRKNLFTAKVGEYLPVAVIECIPDDMHTSKVKWMTRTQPLNSAAFTRIKEYYNWYFVPTNLLWNRFNQFVTGMTDNNQQADSISSGSKLTDQHPYVTLSQIWTYVNVMASQGKVNFFGYDRATLTCKLLEYLGYGDFYGALTSSDFPSDRVDAVVNLFPLLAYQKIYQDHLRDSQWEKAYAPACNINYMKGTSTSLNIPLQDLDYDVENMFDLRYANWNKDYFMGVLPNSQYGDAASIDINSLEFGNTTSWSGSDQSVVFSSRTTSDNGILLGQGSNGNTNPVGFEVNSDGTVSYSDPSFKLLQVTLTNSDVARLRTAMGFSSSSNLASGFSILSLRRAEAVQKMREVMQCHEQDYKSQLEARWNVTVSDAYSDRCKWLGGDVASIDISEVVNTNLQQDVSGLAQTTRYDANIKGKGVGVGDGYVQLSTKCHGYLVCIYHAVPVLDFSINGVKKHNLKSYFTDYAQPELDKTGMVSIPVIELINKSVPDSIKNGLLGYAPQYYEYKTAYDECHGGFYLSPENSYMSLNSWVSPISQEYIQNYAQAMVDSGYNDFMSYYFMKVPPAVLDPIFAFSADSTVGTDQLLVNCYFDIKSARSLDKNGLPY